MSIVLIQGNAKRIALADESVHTVVTSPPYWGLRKYSGNMTQVWGGEPGCAHEWEIFMRERQTGGDSTKSAKQISNLGSQLSKGISEQATCLHCGAWYGELGLEPTPEEYVANMVAVFREVKRVLRSDGQVWLNLGDSYNAQTGKGFPGTGQVNIDESSKNAKRPQPAGIKPKDLVGIPWMIAFALRADGWWLRSDIVWDKPNPMPESVTDRPTKAHEYLFLLTKSAKYFYDADAVREPLAKATISRNLYPHHGSKNTEGAYSISRDREPGEFGDEARGRNRRTVWHIPTKSYSGAHFATYPPALVEPCIKAGTSERGVCPECGAPWERVVEKGELIKHEDARIDEWDRGVYDDVLGDGMKGGKAAAMRDSGFKPNHSYQHSTLGWRPTCDHYPHTERWREFPSQGEMTDDEYYWSTLNIRLERRILVKLWEPYESVPATTFDPFIGSGTTLLVARALGRNGIGLDLSLEYLHLARTRLSLDALDAWGTARKDGKAVTDLPMFEEMR